MWLPAFMDELAQISKALGGKEPIPGVEELKIPPFGNPDPFIHHFRNFLILRVKYTQSRIQIPNLLLRVRYNHNFEIFFALKFDRIQSQWEEMGGVPDNNYN